MRTREKDEQNIELFEKECEFEGCGRTFFTQNTKSRYCCDKHRSKAFRSKNAPFQKMLNDFTKGLTKNYYVLKRLFTEGRRRLTKKEMEVAGINLNYRVPIISTEDGRVAYDFADLAVIPNGNGTEFEIQKK